MFQIKNKINLSELSYEDCKVAEFTVRIWYYPCHSQKEARVGVTIWKSTVMKSYHLCHINMKKKYFRDKKARKTFIYFGILSICLEHLDFFLNGEDFILTFSKSIADWKTREERLKLIHDKPYHIFITIVQNIRKEWKMKDDDRWIGKYVKQVRHLAKKRLKLEI